MRTRHIYQTHTSNFFFSLHCNYYLLFIDTASEDQEVIEQMHKLMAKVDEMKNQRNMFEDQLRKQVQQDDITNVLVTREVTNLDVSEV